MNRRSLITGLISLIAAPAVIRTTGLLMPVKALPIETVPAVTSTFTGVDIGQRNAERIFLAYTDRGVFRFDDGTDKWVPLYRPRFIHTP